MHAFAPNRAPNTPILDDFELDLGSQPARYRPFQQAETFHAIRWI